MHLTSVSKKLGQGIIVYYYCGLSRFFETDVTYVLSQAFAQLRLGSMLTSVVLNKLLTRYTWGVLNGADCHFRQLIKWLLIIGLK